LFKFATIPLQTKIILMLIGAIVLFGGAYTAYQHAPTEKTQDPYVIAIRSNSDTITNQVNDLVKTEGTLDNMVYWHNCDSLLYTIRYQNTEAEQGYPTLAENHKDINVKYRAFLHEAANVVLTCEDGGKPDLSKMNASKVVLY
jgi:hypothetical protein